MTNLPVPQYLHALSKCRLMYSDLWIYRWFNRHKRKLRWFWLICFAELFVVKMILDHASLIDAHRALLKLTGDIVAIAGGSSMLLMILLAGIDHIYIGSVLRKIHRALNADGVIVSMQDVQELCQLVVEERRVR